MKTSDPAPSKQHLRERFQAARLAHSDAEVAAHSAAICERTATLPEISTAKTVHVYWPIIRRREVDTRPLIRTLQAEGKTVVLPVVAAFGGMPTLRHVRFEGEARMQPNRWGIPEPVDTAEVEVSALDAVVVPALGAGRDGHRLGHGHGFYDAFLAVVSVPKIGVVYANTFVDAVPAEPHDVPLDVIVTELETWRVARH